MTTPYRLQRLKGGATAVHNAAYGETMHPGAGPWAEATGLYVEGSELAMLLCRREPGPVVLFDVGLGAAANALAAVACHEQLAQRGRQPRALQIVSFESDPRGVEFAIAEADALQYPRGREAALRQLVDVGTVEPVPGVQWSLRQGDFTKLLADEPARPQVVFFDPFSPRVNHEMWSLRTLEGIYGCRPRAGGTRLITYSTAFGTIAGLLLAGYFVGEGPRVGGGRGGTMAATWFGDLSRPLTPAWLTRWRKDRAPWPPLTGLGEYRALRERLVAHPQWAHFEAERDAEPEVTAPPRRGARSGRQGAEAPAGQGTRSGGATGLRAGATGKPRAKKGAGGGRRAPAGRPAAGGRRRG